MNLVERALLAQLAISQWSGRKFDKKASREVIDANEATIEAGRFNKVLLPGNSYLSAVHSKSNLIRGLFYEHTLPWGLDGMQILPAPNYMNFMGIFRSEKAQWWELVNDFKRNYELSKWEAEHDKRKSLGKLYVPTDYPTLAELDAKFDIDLAIFPVPANDFRVAIASDELTRIHEDVVKRVEEAQAGAMREVWQRLFDRVKKIAEKCDDPKAIFRDTMIENARSMCELLPSLNLTDDPNLEALRQEVEAKLIMHPEILRNDPDRRRDTATEAKKIMEAMKTFMGA